MPHPCRKCNAVQLQQAVIPNSLLQVFVLELCYQLKLFNITNYNGKTSVFQVRVELPGMKRLPGGGGGGDRSRIASKFSMDHRK